MASPSPERPRLPTLRTFPSADRDFGLAVAREFEAWFEATDGEPTPEAFEEAIRAAFPNATVRAQEALARLGGGSTVWYVNRRSYEEGPSAPLTGDIKPAGQTPTYRAARVAAMVGLPMSVLVSWDEVEHLVQPSRTAAGAALYSRDDVEAILHAKRAFARGTDLEDIRKSLADRRVTRGKRGVRPTGTRRLLVLLAERDRYAAEFSEYFLRTEGYEVEVALSAEEAAARATELEPDLAIVDLLISGGAGAELCARMKRSPNSLVLAVSSLDAGDAALQAGADAFLAKPYEPLTFVSVVRDLLGDSALARESAGEAVEGVR